MLYRSRPAGWNFAVYKLYINPFVFVKIAQWKAVDSIRDYVPAVKWVGIHSVCISGIETNMFLHSLYILHSFRDVYVISTSQNLLFSAIRSVSKVCVETTIRHLLIVSWMQISCSLFGKTRNSVCLQNQRNLHRMESFSSRRLAGCLSGVEGGVRASRTKMRVFGWLPNSLVCGCYTVPASVPRL